MTDSIDDTPQELAELTKFCTIWKKYDTNVYVVKHAYLYGIRHEVCVFPEGKLMVNSSRSNYKISMTKEKFIDQIRENIRTVIIKTTLNLISELESHHLDRMPIKQKRFGPFTITKTKVETISILNDALEKGMFSIKLAITVYDNWLIFKKIRQKNNVIVGYSKDEIYVTVSDKAGEVLEPYGVGTTTSEVDEIISDLILLSEHPIRETNK